MTSLNARVNYRYEITGFKNQRNRQTYAIGIYRKTGTMTMISREKGQEIANRA